MPLKRQIPTPSSQEKEAQDVMEVTGETLGQVMRQRESKDLWCGYDLFMVVSVGRNERGSLGRFWPGSPELLLQALGHSGCP